MRFASFDFSFGRKVGFGRPATLLQVGREEVFDRIERDLLVVEIRMVRARHDDERLVVALEELERVLAEVARMGLLAVSRTALRISPAYARSGMLMKESDDVVFQPPFELSERLW